MNNLTIAQIPADEWVSQELNTLECKIDELQYVQVTLGCLQIANHYINQYQDLADYCRQRGLFQSEPAIALQCQQIRTKLSVVFNALHDGLYDTMNIRDYTESRLLSCAACQGLYAIVIDFAQPSSDSFEFRIKCRKDGLNDPMVDQFAFTYIFDNSLMHKFVDMLIDKVIHELLIFPGEST